MISGCPDYLRRAVGRVLLAAGSALLTASVVAGCGTSTPPNALTLYSGQHPETTQALVDAFEKATGIYVVVRSNDEDLLADDIANAGCHSPADVYFSENSPALQFLDSRHLLAPLPGATLKASGARL